MELFNSNLSDNCFHSREFAAHVYSTLMELTSIPSNTFQTLKNIYYAVVEANKRNVCFYLIKREHLQKWLDIEENLREYINPIYVEQLSTMKQEILIYLEKTTSF